MALTTGTRLGSYEIVAPLGAGGMGEVYRAKDTQLGRDVAIKSLPAEFAQDPERLSRFDREAKLLASLSHANIAGIYGLEVVDGARYLVLEFVEGETLARRLERGPLHLDEALEVAKQIAAGVEAAHESGVIHRDLKPGNVMLTPSGVVKVLDFGLAKSEIAKHSVSNPSASSTLTHSMTQAGTILGTAAYMSPEQARGRAVDKRTDNWSFGCVLYELLSGRPPFHGDDPSDTLAMILRSEPDLARLPSETPPTIIRLVRRCLRKEPQRRLQSMGDARVTIEEIQAEAADLSLDPATSTVMSSRRGWLPWVLVGVMTLLTLVSLTAHWSTRTSSEHRRSPHQPARFEIGVRGLYWSAGENGVALSPDGTAIAYVSQSADGESPALWLRDLNDLEPHVLSGTETATNPFWSPDGRLVGYVQHDTIKVVERMGGPSRTVFESGQSFGAPSLSSEGLLLVAPVPPGSRRIRLIPMQGGEPTFATQEVRQGYLAHTYPHWLPDGRRFLYVALTDAASRPSQLYLASLDGGEPRPVRGVHSRAEYAAGRLFFWEDGVVVSRPFDPDAGVFTGDPVPLCETTGAHSSRTAMAVFAVSRSGDVVACGRRDERIGLRWHNRTGRYEADLGEPHAFRNPRLSPDGLWLAVSRGEPRTGAEDIWRFDLNRQVSSRWIDGPGHENSPVWSPGGDRIAYASDSAGPPQIFTRRADGRGETTEVHVDESLPSYPNDWSPDGTSLLYAAFDRTGETDLYRAFLDGREPRLWAGGVGHQFRARFSPKGNWVLFISTELGSMELFVAPLTEGHARQRVSRAGAVAAVWGPFGETIYYAAEDSVFAVPFAPTSGEIGREELLFSLGGRLTIRDFDLEPDAERFLVAASDDSLQRSSITVVLNGSEAEGFSNERR